MHVFIFFLFCGWVFSKIFWCAWETSKYSVHMYVSDISGKANFYVSDKLVGSCGMVQESAVAQVNKHRQYIWFWVAFISGPSQQKRSGSQSSQFAGECIPGTGRSRKSERPPHQRQRDSRATVSYSELFVV